MRKMDLVVGVVLLFVSGCGKPPDTDSTPSRVDMNEPATAADASVGGQTVSFAELMQVDGVNFEKGSDTPFTGTAVRTFADGRKTLTEFRDGKGNGRSVLWHANGQKAMEVTLVDDEPHGTLIKWEENGEEISRMQYVNGQAALSDE